MAIIESWSLFQMTWQYFIVQDQENDKRYQKEYDRYLWTCDKMEDPEPPQKPTKWLINLTAIDQFQTLNNITLK